MKVGIIGTGYVGLPTGVGLAELGNQVTCIDREPSKIEALQAGKITLYEDGLEELFHKNVKAGRIKFTTSMKEGVSAASGDQRSGHEVHSCRGDRVGRAFAGLYCRGNQIDGSGWDGG